MQNHGTSDNSYLITVPGAMALIDVPYLAYAERFGEALAGAANLSNLTHIVCTHLDPNRIPSLEAVLARAQAAGAKPTLILTNPALRVLQSSIGDKPEKAGLLKDLKVTTARSGQVVTLGSNAANTLTLELTPTPRWPDLMVAYYAPARILFSSKLFSAHVAPQEGVVEDKGGFEVFGEDWRYFFDCMLAPSARQAAVALDKMDLVPVTGGTGVAPEGVLKRVREEFAWLRTMILGRSGTPTASAPTGAPPTGPARMNVAMLAPMHGPAVSQAVTQLLREYRDWISEQIKAQDSASVAVFYASAYGNTTALAQAIARGVTKAGVGVEMYNLELVSLEEVAAAVRNSDGFILGSPTLGGHMPTQVSVALGTIIREQSAKGLPCGVFGSFGWSGEAVDEMEGRLKDAGFKFSFPSIRVKFKPTAKDVLVCEDSGRDLALSVKKKAKAKEAAAAPGVRAAASASGPQLAAGRLVGSLSVLTATSEDASTAMLASWVSQASFDPPGLTVAVKKDRAMEPLLQVGNRFAISMVPEGGERRVMRQLARPFAPGEDRLAGLEFSKGEFSGAPLLKDANAHMECQVASRMEAGDHWVVYATVANGKVVDDSAATAVHHRKVANHY